MGVPYYDNPGGNLSVQVELRHTSNVFLVDQPNFNSYQRGQQYKYYGGSFDHSPAVITISGSGRWYLIVDNGSGEQYRYKWIK